MQASHRSALSEMGKLFDLQEVDLALRRLRESLADSEEARRAAASRERYEKASSALKAAGAAAAEAERALRTCELDLVAAEENVERLRAKVYGGEVTNLKELAALEERLNIETRKKGELEEEVLASMERLEERKAQLAKFERAFSKVKKEHEAAESAFERAKEAWTAEIARLQSRREAIAAGIDPRTLKAYEALVPSTNGRPVATVNNRTCGGCHVALPTSANAKETARCPNCGRLLWWNA